MNLLEMYIVILYNNYQNKIKNFTLIFIYIYKYLDYKNHYIAEF